MKINKSKLDGFDKFIKNLFKENQILLHRPVFSGNEKLYLSDCIDSNFVSSVGARVTEFEGRIASFTGATYAIATMNGSAALHIALQLAGVKADSEVITQAVTFVATCNAIAYIGAKPIFIDVDCETLGMSPDTLRAFLHTHAVVKQGQTFNRRTGKQITACLPMHTFGHSCRIDEVIALCDQYGIPVVEDAAESLGSYYKGRHTGTFGLLGIFSFNGNKIITTGGGGMIVTDNPELAAKAKHITTTAKVPHAYEYVHDKIGYNYRLPNINAALGCAQMDQLEYFIEMKRELARRYAEFFQEQEIAFFTEPAYCRSNYWLNTVIFDSLSERNKFLEYTNKHGVMTRPLWHLMPKLAMFKGCYCDDLKNSFWLEERVVNIPSSVPLALKDNRQ